MPVKKSSNFQGKPTLYPVLVIVIADVYGVIPKVRLVTGKNQQDPELLVLFPSFTAFPRSTGARLRAAR